MTKFNFYAAGVQFHQLKTVIGLVQNGDELDLSPEPENKFDENAVAIEFFNPQSADMVMVGYVPAKYSPAVSAFLETADHPVCIVDDVTPSAKPWEQLRVTICERDEVETDA